MAVETEPKPTAAEMEELHRLASQKTSPVEKNSGIHLLDVARSQNAAILLDGGSLLTYDHGPVTLDDPYWRRLVGFSQQKVQARAASPKT